jgi:hypothetical protein
MKRLIYIYDSFIAIKIRGTKCLVFWFRKPPFLTRTSRCYIQDCSILDMNEEDGLKYLSGGLDKIINRTKDVATPKQESVLSNYRTLMNEMINYYNSEWKI